MGGKGAGELMAIRAAMRAAMRVRGPLRRRMLYRQQMGEGRVREGSGAAYTLPPALEASYLTRPLACHKL